MNNKKIFYFINKIKCNFITNIYTSNFLGWSRHWCRHRQYQEEAGDLGESDDLEEHTVPEE